MITKDLKESIVSDNTLIIRDLVNDIDVFQVTEIKNNNVVFVYKENFTFTFLMFHEEYDFKGNIPLILMNNSESDLPHILMEELDIEGRKYRYVCLIESEQYIFSGMSFKEKALLLLNQLQRLLEKSPREIEIEYQKEFLFYWNRAAVDNGFYHSYIDSNTEPQIVKCYRKDGVDRLVGENIKLNDLRTWKKVKDYVLYIPIINSTGIIPPTKNKPWSKTEVLNILRNLEEDKVANETYEYLKAISLTKKSIKIVFSMTHENREILFCCELVFKNSGVRKFFNKIKLDLETVKPKEVKRKELEYLHKSIGNIPIDEKIGIIGLGSLGSYLSEELVNSGASNLVLFDHDILEDENLFRHKLPSISVRNYKVTDLNIFLKLKHPQIQVKSYYKKVTANNINQFIEEENLDYLIFTIGSTDQQLELAEAITKSQKQITVFHSWLEGDGENSHILVSKNDGTGCYRCIHTNEYGDFSTNNINTSNKVNTTILRDGCGGTRVSYGNRTLLTASNGLLKAIKENREIESSFIISGNIDKGLRIKLNFQEPGCGLCESKRELKKV